MSETDPQQPATIDSAELRLVVPGTGDSRRVHSLEWRTECPRPGCLGLLHYDAEDGSHVAACGHPETCGCPRAARLPEAARVPPAATTRPAAYDSADSWRAYAEALEARLAQTSDDMAA